MIMKFISIAPRVHLSVVYGKSTGIFSGFDMRRVSPHPSAPRQRHAIPRFDYATPALVDRVTACCMKLPVDCDVDFNSCRWPKYSTRGALLSSPVDGATSAIQNRRHGVARSIGPRFARTASSFGARQSFATTPGDQWLPPRLSARLALDSRGGALQDDRCLDLATMALDTADDVGMDGLLVGGNAVAPESEGVTAPHDRHIRSVNVFNRIVELLGHRLVPYIHSWQAGRNRCGPASTAVAEAAGSQYA